MKRVVRMTHLKHEEILDDDHQVGDHHLSYLQAFHYLWALLEVDQGPRSYFEGEARQG